MSSRPRTLPSSFIEPCLPSPAARPPAGDNWIHGIKHDGYRLMARRDAAKRLGSRYVSGRSRDWLKSKNPSAPAVKRSARPKRIGTVKNRTHGQAFPPLGQRKAVGQFPNMRTCEGQRDAPNFDTQHNMNRQTLHHTSLAGAIRCASRFQIFTRSVNLRCRPIDDPLY
jgi:hypothetical protein